ncbi:VWA domain-containing protein [Streptomyces sp. N2-109]|uniref:VWA domain-containing protein n=1 Tax=Streptomyces gossypii TaxID=2883101 RepID=A0ABT2JUL8_9ACTN|nr:VWA domain-containing protein [Streptomyces gossypii]MCT2591577.1 VWA domain-containing protein [Streptomyces gossypii]
MSTYEMGLADGCEERQPVVILLDTSASMGRPAESPRIDELNDALARWFDEVRSLSRLRSRVEVALITFDSRVRAYDARAESLVPVEGVASDRLFAPVDEVRPPRLTASGVTRLTEAVETALTLARERYRALQGQRVQVRRPFLWVLTDGAPSDAEGQPQDAAALAGTARRLRQGEEQGECIFQAVGVRGADLPLLHVLAPKSTLMLDSYDFGQILDLVFQSSDQLGAVQHADDAHRQVAERAARQKRMDELERKFR